MTNVLETWTSFYANHAIVRTVILFFHIGGLVIAGGSAIYTARAVLRVSRRPTAERTRQLEALHGTHRTVIFGFAVVIASGLLMLAADTDTLLHSRLFWFKMALVVALSLNGLLLTWAGRQAQSGAPAAWRTLSITSMISLALWMLTTLAGAALPNIS
jgi:energy-converting hydrogenase Eha subunit G